MTIQSQGNSINSDFEIKEVDSIVAIEILKDTYKFDVVKYDKKELQKVVDLLNLAITNRAIPEEKEESNDDNTVSQEQNQ